MGDHYETLGVSRTALIGEIRKAYLTIARERHPDRFTDAAEKVRAQELFQKATEAFNTLTNERARAEYDAELAKPKLTTPEEIAADAYARGVRQLEGRDVTGAVELFRQAVYLMPQEARYHGALGHALSSDPRTAREAVLALEQAAQLAPRSAQIHLELAVVLEKQGLSIRARRAVETALRLAPADPAVLRVAARLGAGEGPSPSGDSSRRRP
jgi:curved DNA-binding protein CbpA